MVIWDAHSCLPLSENASLELLGEHRLAGVNVVCVNVGMDFNPLHQIFSVIASFRRQIAMDPNLRQVTDIASVFEAIESGSLGVMFDLEGSVPLLDSPAMVQLYYDLGVRQMHLAYNRNNSVAGGCHDSPMGLTPLGEDILSEINDVGIIMDVSHCSEQTVFDVCFKSKKPVIFSHSNVRDLVEHPRNISIEQMHACAETGGVVCINGVFRFLGGRDWKAACEHLLFLIDIVGSDHVGIGLDVMLTQPEIDDMPVDINHSDWWPPRYYPNGIGGLGYLRPSDLELIFKGLVASGVGSEDLSKIMGGNMLRVARETWVAK